MTIPTYAARNAAEHAVSTAATAAGYRPCDHESQEAVAVAADAALWTCTACDAVTHLTRTCGTCQGTGARLVPYADGRTAWNFSRSARVPVMQRLECDACGGVGDVTVPDHEAAQLGYRTVTREDASAEWDAYAEARYRGA